MASGVVGVAPVANGRDVSPSERAGIFDDIEVVAGLKPVPVPQGGGDGHLALAVETAGAVAGYATEAQPTVGCMDGSALSAVHHHVRAGHASPLHAAMPEVVVRVLGPVDVLGAARPLARAWTLDLAVYLGMHPRGSAAEAWTTALWPDRLPASPTRHSTVSALRRSLGRDSGGHDHLPRGGGTLRFAPSVTTDWERFSALTADGSHPAAWRGALDLVRGRPFDGLRAPDWTVLEGFGAQVSDAVVRLALRLAEDALARGDPEAAERAARRALLASPYDERLYRLLMRAADQQGNPGGVESAMAELLCVVGEGRSRPAGRGAPSESIARVHPATAELYRQLSLRTGTGAGTRIGTGAGTRTGTGAGTRTGTRPRSTGVGRGRIDLVDW